jgi:transposase
MNTSSTCQMDDTTKAFCYSLRNPGRGKTRMKYCEIQKLVRKKDGKTKPTIQAIQQAVMKFKIKKTDRGRKKGARATTKEEDKVILQKFHKLRPPGHGIDSNRLHRSLPSNIKAKIGRRTVIRRIGEKGFHAKRKLRKDDKGEKHRTKRFKWCKKFQHWKALQWSGHVQAVGDLKDFTWYPKELQARFKQLRAPWTYMSDKERHKPAFQRPKHWFPKKQWEKVKKQKVFGFTASNGKMLAFLVNGDWNTAKWSRLIKSKLAPWLKKTFPGKTSFKIILDGEKTLRGAAAKTALRQAGITILAGWPGYSPDLNPQENVWSKAEPALRNMETGKETFETWCTKLVPAVYKYPTPEKLVGSMEGRIKQCLERQGSITDY